jgi:hypothetical protein
MTNYSKTEDSSVLTGYDKNIIRNYIEIETKNINSNNQVINDIKKKQENVNNVNNVDKNILIHLLNRYYINDKQA